MRTPTLRSATLSAILGADVWLKFENLQFTSSFKDRGALNRLLQLTPDERRRGVVAMSAGNHAQGVAYHATRLGIPATIVMPRFTPNVKVARHRGARGHGRAARRRPRRGRAPRPTSSSSREGLVFVPPLRRPAHHRRPGHRGPGAARGRAGPRRVVVPVGGGGLLAGHGRGGAPTCAPDIELIGVQSELYPSMIDEVRHLAARPSAAPRSPRASPCRGAGRLTAPIIAALVDDLVLVTEDAHRGRHQPPARHREDRGRGRRCRRRWPPCCTSPSASPAARSGW